MQYSLCKCDLLVSVLKYYRMLIPFSIHHHQFGMIGLLIWLIELILLVVNSLVWNVSKLYMSLLECAQAIHLVSRNKKPFFEVWYHKMSSTKIFNFDSGWQISYKKSKRYQEMVNTKILPDIQKIVIQKCVLFCHVFSSHLIGMLVVFYVFFLRCLGKPEN